MSFRVTVYVGSSQMQEEYGCCSDNLYTDCDFSVVFLSHCSYFSYRIDCFYAVLSMEPEITAF